MSSVNYRFNITFAPDSFDTVNGYMTIDSTNIVTKLRLTSNNAIERLAPGTVNVTSVDDPPITFFNNNICELANKQTVSTSGAYVANSNTQGSTFTTPLQIDLGDIAVTGGSLITVPSFITPTPAETTNWILDTTSDGNSPPGYRIRIFSWDLGTSTISQVTDAFTFTTTAALNPSCFMEGTKLFSHVHDKDIYVNIEDLRKGDLVNTYLYGPKAIKFIGKGFMTNNPDQWNGCVKKLPKSGDMTDDLFVTGAHSILVDKLSEKEEEGMISIYGTTERKIDDKTLLLSWVSEKFETVEENNEYTYYHLVLEHDDDEKKRYGIWANGVLTESQCEKHFLENPYELI